jgi:hypothetical protein
VSAQTKALGGVLLAIAVVAFLLLTPLPDRWQGDWQSKFWDLTHVPLFAGMTLYLSWILRRSWAAPAIIALVVAGLAELIQDHVGRTGDILDFVRGALGVGTAVVALHAWQGPRTLLHLGGHALVIVGLVAWPIADSLPRLLDAYEGYLALPTLADFQTPRQLLRWQCQQSQLLRLPDPEQPERWCGRLELLPGPARYPGAILPVLSYDWRPYQRLCWSFSCEEAGLPLTFSVRSGLDDQNRSNHAQVGQTFQAGAHVVRLDLATLAQQGHFGPLDLSNIRYVQVFSLSAEQTRTVYLRRVWLE